MGQGTMTLRECAEEVEHTTIEQLAREAFEGRLRLHPLPECPACGADAGRPCAPDCSKAGTQVVWLGDWFKWSRSAPAGETPERTADDD